VKLVGAETTDRLVGSLIDGRYRIIRSVADGGFGRVYAAVHLGLGAPVALKALKVSLQLRPDELSTLVGGFFEEARMLKRLRHPNIVAAHDVGLLPADEDGRELPYLVMDWCSGPTLEQMLRERDGRPMSIGEAWTLFEPLLDAIAHAHGAGVVHRDLKPGNVLLELGDGPPRPRVIDFGIAKLVVPHETAGSGATRTTSGSRSFTLQYAAPEQLAGARTGPWTDVHALALLFVEMVTGHVAVGGDGDARLAIFDPVRPTPGAHGVDVGAIEPILARALALRPGERYADAAAFAGAMRAAIASQEIPGSEASIASPVPKPSSTQDDRTPQPSARTLRTQPDSSPGDVSDEARVTTAAAPSARSRVLGTALVVCALLVGVGVWWGLARHAAVPAPPTGNSGELATPTPEPSIRAGDTTWYVQAGTWSEDGDGVLGRGGQIYSDREFGDGTLELDVELVDGPGGHSIGIGFRAKPVGGPADGSGYGVNFKSIVNTFNVFKGVSGDWEPIDPAFPSYHASPVLLPRKNHFVLRASGRSFAVDANDRPMVAFEDGVYAGGRVTLWVSSSIETVRFSKIHFSSKER
jgi:serine/threonine protein kinase